jgi:hypothetical protein
MELKENVVIGSENLKSSEALMSYDTNGPPRGML